MTPTRTEAIDLIRTFDEWQYDQASGDYIKTIDGGTVRKRDDEFRYDTDIDAIYPVCKKFHDLGYCKQIDVNDLDSWEAWADHLSKINKNEKKRQIFV